MRSQIRRNYLAFLTLLVFSFAIYFLVSQHLRSVKASPKKITRPCTAQTGEIDHYLYAATYSTKGGFTSILGLNNSLNRDMTARVTLFSKHGDALTAPEITLGPHKNHGFNVAD